MEYKVIYSKRKTIAISIVDGAPIIKAPIGTRGSFKTIAFFATIFSSFYFANGAPINVRSSLASSSV